MKRVRNTKTETEQNPQRFFLEAMVFGANAAVENQEAAGQASFVDSDTLPIKGNHEFKHVLEGFGFQFLGCVEGDDLFQYVKLPTGWKKKATDHSMWSSIVDNRNRERVSIFYKAAFYDRDAFYRLDSRFSVHQDYDRQGKGIAVSMVRDADGITVYETEPVKLPAKGPLGHNAEFYRLIEEARDRAEAWLRTNYPDYRNPAAYWD